MTTASFLIAGVQKAGTTALHSYLSEHPSLFLPKQKELHFFDQSADWKNPIYRTYNQFFEAARPDQLAGEATPIYTYWVPSAKRIHAYNPRMKLIISLRDPVRRAFSHWEMETSRGMERLSFSEAIREGRSRFVSKDPGSVCVHRVFSYVERGFYGEQVARLMKYFPREQLFFLKKASLRKELHPLMDRLCHFLQIPKFQSYPMPRTSEPVKKKKNLGKINAEDSRYLHSLYQSDIEKTEKLTGLDLSNWK